MMSVMSPRSHLVKRRETRANADDEWEDSDDSVDGAADHHNRRESGSGAAWCIADGLPRQSKQRRMPPLAGRRGERRIEQNRDQREWTKVLKSTPRPAAELEGAGVAMSAGGTAPLRSPQRLLDQRTFLHDGGRESTQEAQQRAIGEHVADVLVNATNCRRSGVRAAPAMGELLLDFLSYFGERFEPGRTGCSLRHGGFRFDRPPAGPGVGAPAGLVLEDPLCLTNNVGRSCYRTAELQHAFSTMKARLDTFMVHEAALDAGSHPLMGRGWAKPAKHVGADQEKGRSVSHPGAVEESTQAGQAISSKADMNNPEAVGEERPGAPGYSRLLENVKALNAIFAR